MHAITKPKGLKRTTDAVVDVFGNKAAMLHRLLRESAKEKEKELSDGAVREQTEIKQPPQLLAADTVVALPFDSRWNTGLAPPCEGQFITKRWRS